jgi:tetratricopeptide (TPR) repeat protein
VAPLLASLLSLPLADRYPPLQLTPQRQRQKTLEAILALLRAHAAQQPVLFIVEDLHWVDPSTLELLTLFIDQEPTARILTLLTCRPEFRPPWGSRAHVTSLIPGHLPPPQVEQMIDRVTGGKRLPAEVRQQVVTKTDGVPLFVEELTKTVLESGLLREEADHYELVSPLPSFAIPTTLHDSLMARLDRLDAAKEVAQLGATLGRTFPYELLRAVSPWGEKRLQHALTQLVEAELLQQRGVPPHVTYAFKHALIQETAYQSLLRRKRQQYHRQTAHILEQRFPEIAETQPEFLAYHFTEASLAEQAIPYWQRAGQHAVERSANVEAVSQFTKGLELLKSLPTTPEHTKQELALQLALGPPLRMIKGYTAPEVEGVYTRAYGLSQQMGDSRQQFSSLKSLSRLYLNRGMIQKAHELCEQCLTLAQRAQDPVFLLEAHETFGTTSFYLGELVMARRHLEQGVALYNLQQDRSWIFSSGIDPGVVCLSYLAWTLWLLGYPDQALTRSNEALTLAQQLSHANSLNFALTFASVISIFRREIQRVQEQAEATIALAREQGFVRWVAMGTAWRGWALAEQGEVREGIAQICQAIAMRGEVGLLQILLRLAEMYGKAGQAEDGLRVLAEALAAASKSGERRFEAEFYRLQGELLLQSGVRSPESGVVNPQFAEVETCFRQAIDVARSQYAKSLELRATMSLTRLWQQQGKRQEARAMLEGIYGWFTEGFDTLDLQEAKALIEALR